MRERNDWPIRIAASSAPLWRALCPLFINIYIYSRICVPHHAMRVIDVNALVDFEHYAGQQCTSRMALRAATNTAVRPRGGVIATHTDNGAMICGVNTHT